MRFCHLASRGSGEFELSMQRRDNYNLIIRVASLITIAIM